MRLVFLLTPLLLIGIGASATEMHCQSSLMTLDATVTTNTNGLVLKNPILDGHPIKGVPPEGLEESENRGRDVLNQVTSIFTFQALFAGQPETFIVGISVDSLLTSHQTGFDVTIQNAQGQIKGSGICKFFADRK